MKRIYLLLLIMLVVATSCKKDWLDEKRSSSLVVPKTLPDLRLLLNNTTVFYPDGNSPGEVSSDNVNVNADQLALILRQEANMHLWQKEMAIVDAGLTDWRAPYTTVFYCNTVLEGLKDIQPTIAEQEEYNDIKGNALFHRARAFYNLAQSFCKPYTPSSAATDLGIPLRLSSDIHAITPRSTIEQTYSQIINDMKQAETLVRQTSKTKVEASKTVVYGYLARILLSIEDYEQAYKYADLCLQQYSTLMDYNQLNASATYPISELNVEVLFQGQMTNYSIYSSYGNIPIELYNQYHVNDLRRTIFFKFRTDGTIRFYGTYGGGAVYGGVATDEVYLIRAECLARKNDPVNALKDLNALLIKRFKTGTFTPLVAGTAKAALDIVLTERRKELLHRGLRWPDLRRLNKDPNYAVTITRRIGSETYILPPNDSRYTLQIPNKIILETGIQQN